MCRPIVLLRLALFVLVCGGAGARPHSVDTDSGAPDGAAACQAAAMLQAAGWAQVFEITNDRPDRHYPARFYATIFAFNDILWFYTPSEGTESLSIYEGQTEADRAELGPLLRQINPGFVAFRAVSHADLGRNADVLGSAGAEQTHWAPLANGCFVESVHELLRLQAAGIMLTEARVLLFYVRQGLGLKGHAVLVYATAGGHFGWDPAKPNHDRELPRFGADTAALRVARAFLPDQLLPRLQRARFLPVKRLATAAINYASHD